MLKNKHLVLAMIIAPVLAVLAYIGTDQLVSEVPHSAEEGASYPLAARSNCRYNSGNCTLHNGDIEIRIEAVRSADSRVEFKINTDTPAQKVLIAFSRDQSESIPKELPSITSKALAWRTVAEIESASDTKMLLALNIDGASYYAETPTVFVDYETSYSRSNFSSQ